MSNSYCISEMDASVCLNHIVDDIVCVYGKCVESFQFAPNTNDSRVIYDGTLPISSFMPASVIIGTKNLANNRVNGYVRTQDFVNCVRMIYHEERHLQQHINMYKNKNAISDVVDMAKFQTICSVFPDILVTKKHLIKGLSQRIKSHIFPPVPVSLVIPICFKKIKPTLISESGFCCELTGYFL
uniref:hypothetical protein n=1 Tax=Agathobacter sp. TaxID=2021311 RepID=UPI004055BB5C